MKTIVFSSIKGGTGKSTLAILCANYCAAAGARVLVIDLDIQNSASFYYLDDFTQVDRYNVAHALHNQDLTGNIIPSMREGVQILPSHFALVDLRSINERSLKRLLLAKPLPYDFVFIDCGPTYDNIVLNGVNCADLIITPVAFTPFDFKGAMFYRDKLEKETDRIASWRVLFNFYRPARSDSPDAINNQYEASFKEEFGKAVVPVTIPQSAVVRRAIDTKTRITEAPAKQETYNAIKALAEYVGAKGSVGGF